MSVCIGPACCASSFQRSATVQAEAAVLMNAVEFGNALDFVAAIAGQPEVSIDVRVVLFDDGRCEVRLRNRFIVLLSEAVAVTIAVTVADWKHSLFRIFF